MRSGMTVFNKKTYYKNAQAYRKDREQLIKKERRKAFDWDARKDASPLEIKAADVVRRVQESDQKSIYDEAEHLNGKKRYIGGPFLENLDLINGSRLIKIARKMPKGAHLHCHYNACLPPTYLVEHARGRTSMYIKSSLALVPKDRKAFDESEIQFQILSTPAILGNIFEPSYVPMTWMSYPAFCENFEGGEKAAENWLVSKLALTEEQVYGMRQTVRGVWNLFAVGTRMMKGLFGYESAFRAYTSEVIQSFVDDKIQYAELRPNFPANVLAKDDASGTITNADLCQIILDESTKKLASLKAGEYFRGVKIIYCAPKLLDKDHPAEAMAANLDECIKLKQQFPQLICGFDLVGPEETMAVINDYIKELLEFRAKCRVLALNIPFIFHAGETLENGGRVDGNLFDALMLNSKRIGHGFALAQHPVLMKLFKEKRIALEICPIGNEILHLCPRIGGHAMHILLANNVPCTINCDNSVFYSSTLSHDFYQVLIGSKNQSLFGWKVLAKWSLEYSCLSTEGHLSEMSKEMAVWETSWVDFCKWIISTHPDEAAAFDASLKIVSPQEAR